MNKIYCLDTNVLLHDPNAIFSFCENDVVIPAVVLEEVDSKKRLMDELGRNAREISRILDRLRVTGKIYEGIKLDNGGTLRIELNHSSFSQLKNIFVEKTNDNRILAVAKNLQLEQEEENSSKTVILVSKDALMRIKAESLGIVSEDFLSDKIVLDDSLYTGSTELLVTTDQLDLFYNKKELPTELFKNNFFSNQFVLLKNIEGTTQSAIGMVSPDVKKIKKLTFSNDYVWGIHARNVQQTAAIELLLRKDIQLVTLTGKAGTGKTLLALAAALYQVEDLNLYKKIVVARPIMPVGKEIGHLPGEKEEKLRPWMQPIFDNLEHLFNVKHHEELHGILAGMKSIEVEALTYIRGRSIPDQFIIIDEAQNLTKHEVKTIITRVGENSKIILMGDPEQIDHPYLDAYSNGLSYVVEKFKDIPIAGHIQLQKGERSALAQLAATLL